MERSLTILDERRTWFGPAIKAAQARGYKARRIFHGHDAVGVNGLGFIRPHAKPAILRRNIQSDDLDMRLCLTMVQDRQQVVVYDNKTLQYERFGTFMPDTWHFLDLNAALDFLQRGDVPDVLVGKADVGASSKNVTILDTRAKAEEYVRKVFTTGIEVDHCAGGRGEGSEKSIQKGHILLQRFIPHECTWRVNLIGRRMAVFQRFNYPDRPVAQTGNTQPVMKMTPEIESLLSYAEMVGKAIGTRWCAFDILRDGHDWKLLETSLAWPWPGVGEAAPFFGTDLRWPQMWELMLDEYEAGVWWT